VARALVGERLVSNISKTDAQGRFNLKVPTVGANAINLDQVKVELSPPDAATVKPRLLLSVTAAKPNLGVLRLPPVPNPQPLDVPVAVQGTAMMLPGVTLRFTTMLEKTATQTATLVREGQTDKDGVAHLILLPGTADQPRQYTVTVKPPPTSEYAARCFPGYAVATAPAGPTRVGTRIDVVRKLEVAGQVTDGNGAPQPDVIMTATRQAVTGPQDCGLDVLSGQSTVTTAADGSYKLALDPGRYRLEYEPPMGSGSPVFVEPDVLVDKALPQRPVTLPGGVVAMGVVTGVEDKAVVGCEVRVYGPPNDGQPPELRARTRTVADGRFMIVLPGKP
jgi:hypothetical protein